MADALEQLKHAPRRLHVARRARVPPRLGPAHDDAARRLHGTARATSSLLERLAHEKLTDPEVGRLLDELEPRLDSLDPDSWDAAIDPHRRGATTRRPSRCRPGCAARWCRPAVGVRARLARGEGDVELRHLPAAARAQRRAAAPLRRVLREARDEPYDILLDDFEPEMKTAEVTRIFDEIKPELVRLIADLRDREVDDSFLVSDFPIDEQVALDYEVVDLFGHRPNSWRIDPTEHPFASGAGIDDIRITTHYYPEELKSLFSTMHEYGHGLYAHQLPREYAHLPVGQHTSLGIHESQSRLWENLVGRSLPFWRFFYPRLQARFPKQFGGVDVEQFYAAREQGAAVAHPHRGRRGDVRHARHPALRARAGHHQRPRRAQGPAAALGGEDGRVPRHRGARHAHGVLQDMHWASGLIGYFSTYLLGTVMSVQIWEKADEELGGLDEQIERGEFAPLREWLGENIHSQGRKYVAAGAAPARDRLHDRREALSRVSRAEVRRSRHRVDRADTLYGHGPVAQRIERQPSKLRAVVRFHPGPSCRVVCTRKSARVRPGTNRWLHGEETSMSCGRLAATVVAVAAMVLATQAVAAVSDTLPPPTLSGESFVDNAPSVTGNCNPDGTSTISFSAAGAATRTVHRDVHGNRDCDHRATDRCLRLTSRNVGDLRRGVHDPVQCRERHGHQGDRVPGHRLRDPGGCRRLHHAQRGRVPRSDSTATPSGTRPRSARRAGSSQTAGSSR